MKLKTHQMTPLRRTLVNDIEHLLNCGFEAMKELEPETNLRMSNALRNMMDETIRMLRESVQIEDVEEEEEDDELQEADEIARFIYQSRVEKGDDEPDYTAPDGGKAS
jgi:hypothetical protein